MEYGASYWLAGVAFQRALAAIYAIAFTVALRQFRALHGERGIEPAHDRLRQRGFRQAPSLFYFHYSDRFFAVVASCGLSLALLATVGISDWGPIWLSMAVWGLLWLLYLSIVNLGGTFYGFGWESKLLDAGFLAIFMGPTWMAKPFVIVLLLRWLLFRVELGAGLIKMRGDRCWRDLTCMLYHHETQPMPNPLSWRFHNSPRWWHKTETLGNHIIQLGVVWLLFAPQPIASVAGTLIIFSQLWLVQSGNYAWLNFLTIVVALPTLSDGVLTATLGMEPPTLAPVPTWFALVGYAVAGLVAVLSIQPIRNLLSRDQLMNYSFNPLHLVNTYGAFGSVTKQREEVVIEGTDEDEITDTTVWREYEFKGKPSRTDRRPRQIAPYHLRLDWQLWFVPFSRFGYPRWFLSFLRKLLENDLPVLRLLRTNPFPEAPPRHVRVSLYRYRFTTPRERRETGLFWQRTYLEPYLPPMDLRALSRILGPDELNGRVSERQAQLRPLST